MIDADIVAIVIGLVGLAAFLAFVITATRDKSDGRWN